MRSSPYGFEIVENCSNCELRDEKFFCSVGAAAVRAFDQISVASVYPAGSVLYVEGQAARGVFMVCRGRAKLSIASRDGKSLITRVAHAGELLGVGSAILGAPYQATVETLEACQIRHVKREEFLHFIKEHADACYRVTEQLSRECHDASDHIRSLGLSHSASEKLAHLILSWCDEGGKESPQGTRVKMLMTHHEVSQLIGTSRETVTRILGEMRERGILSIRGSTMIVHNRAALEAMVLL
jgi:CRP/FNR family transcriptional regulator